MKQKTKRGQTASSSGYRYYPITIALFIIITVIMYMGLSVLGSVIP